MGIRPVLLCVLLWISPAALLRARDYVVTPQDYGAAADGRKDDTRAIQAAIDAVSFPPGDDKVGIVRFPTGTYRITRPLFVGYDFAKRPDPELRLVSDFGPSTKNTRPGGLKQWVLLQGTGKVSIDYQGPETDKYMLYFVGEGRRRGFDCITNLNFLCNYRCRGLLVYNVTYQCAISGLRIFQSRQVGLELLKSWGSRVEGIHIEHGRGIAVRAWGFNSSWGHNWHISACGVDHSDYHKRTELHEYLAANGPAATQAKYGSDLIVDWPPEEDKTVIDWAGTPVQTPAEHRASLVLVCNLAELHSVSFEGVYNGPYPAVSLNARDVLLQNTRFEGNYLTGPKIRICGGAGHNVIAQIAIADPVASACAVEMLGINFNNAVRHVRGQGLREAVVVFRGRQGARFYGNCVEHTAVRNVLPDGTPQPVPPAKWDLAEGAVQEGNLVEGIPTSPVTLKDDTATPSIFGSWLYERISRPGRVLVAPATLKRLEDLTDGYDGNEVCVIFQGGTAIDTSAGKIRLAEPIRNNTPRKGTAIWLLRVGGVWRETRRATLGADF